MKSGVHQLAGFGGSPHFVNPLHVGGPNLPDVDELVEDLRNVLISGILTNNGPRVREFETAVANAAGVRNCVATCNATVALQIAARAMNLSGEVILPAFTFIATAHAMEWVGLTPVFADVDPLTHTLCPDSARRCIGPETTAIVPVHLWGHCCNTSEIRRIAHEANLKVLYDASHALGGHFEGTTIGSFGDAEVFSFHATKFIQSIEGGAIVTDDDELAGRCRRLRSFGFTGLTEVSDIGTNGKMNELSAAVGLRSVASLSQLKSINFRNRGIYQRLLRDIPGLQIVNCMQSLSGNSQYFVLRIDADRFGITRDDLVSLLRAEGVFARAYFSPGCHLSEPYCSSRKHLRVPLPVTEDLTQTVMQLPTGSAVGIEQIQGVCGLIQFIHEHAIEVNRLLNQKAGIVKSHPHDPAAPPQPALREAG
ncbi:MAG: DegT/DnrJ/EryC1/StrS family aminotransferase [Planctomycetaceae bacterium]|nr:DegT/DnrJ/EryC1/StrS family aminotransferase [Planctomycetaceae bacterium]